MRRLLRYTLGLAAAALSALACAPAQAQCDPAWLYGPDQSYPGLATAGPRAMAVYDDGSGPGLYVAGGFTIAGDLPAVRGIARWDGAAWRPVGAGLDGSVFCLAIYDHLLIAAGRFTSPADPTIANIAAWDGAAWRPLAEGLPRDVLAMAVYQGDLYASTARPPGEGTPNGFISRWNGSSWQRLIGPSGPVGPSGSSTSVGALAVFQNELYAGGLFEQAGGNTSRYLARWDGSRWKPLLGEPSLPVDDLCVYRDKLIVSTRSSKVGTLRIRNLAAWDGRSWSTLGDGLDGSFISTLGVFGDRLYVSGYVDLPGSTDETPLVTWDGARWQAVPGKLDFYPAAMAEFQGAMFVGTSVGASPSGGPLSIGISRLDGQEWSGLTAGFNREVLELQTADDGVYAVGRFTRAGSAVGVSADERLARWNGHDWEFVALQGWHIARHQGRLAVAVWDTSAGYARNVRLLDGSTSTPLGGSFNGPIDELFSFGDDLIAAGSFTAVDGVPANRIARWNGSAWLPMAGGLSLNPLSLTAYRGELIAAGDAWVWRWNGSAWSAIGGAPRGLVNAMTTYGDRLILSGHFDTVGLATTARSIATWNGTSWARLGSGAQSLAGIEGTVTSLALLCDDLVAAGEFDSAGGIPAANIARWDGTSWHAMGGGTNDRINSLAVYNNELILGGEFTLVDSRVSAYWARWGCQPSVFEEPSLDPVMEILYSLLDATTRR